MNDKIGSFIIDIEGKELSQEDKEVLAHPLVGGVILFTRNYEARAQIKHLCDEIRAASQNPLVIMVDQEGGRVQRFTTEFTRLPPMAEFGKIYSTNPQKACVLAKDCGWLMATEILSVGIDLSLAPVLDLNKTINTAIGTRAFHSDPQVVCTLAGAFAQGMREAGMAATGKHFPGHGSVTVDSHVAIPVDKREMSAIEQDDMIPFARMIKDGFTGMMAAHIIFPQVDKLAVGFSHYWLQDVLRKQLGFNGIIFSDDLSMEGANISKNYSDRFNAAREAGCDLALLCNNRRGVVQVLDNVAYESFMLSKNKWSALQGVFPTSEPFNNMRRWQETQQLLSNMIE